MPTYVQIVSAPMTGGIQTAATQTVNATLKNLQGKGAKISSITSSVSAGSPQYRPTAIFTITYEAEEPIE